MKARKLGLTFALALAILLLFPACTQPTTTAPKPSTLLPPTSAATTAPATSPKPSASTAVAPIVAASSSPAIKEMNLIFWDFASLIAIKATAEQCIQRVNQATNGKIKLKYESGPLYGSGFDVSKVIGSKTVDLGYIGVSYHVKQFPISSISEVVGVTSRPESSTFAFWDMWKEFPEISAEWERANLKLIGMAIAPPCIIMSKKPIRTVGDLKGLQVRATGWNSMALKELGATPVSMSWADIYPALERGTLDAASNCHVEGAYNAGFHEVTKYTVDIGMGPFFTNAVAINLDLWKSLTPEVQKIFLDSFGDYWNKATLVEWSNVQPKVDEAFRKYNLEVYKLPPAEMAKAQQIARTSLLSQWAKDLESAGYAKTYTSKVKDRFISLAEKYEKEAPVWYTDFYTKYATGK